MSGGSDDKTEQATPRKKDKAREKGQVANSKEVASAVVLLTSFLVFYFAAPWMFRNLMELMKEIFVMPGKVEVNLDTLMPLIRSTTVDAAKIMSPLMLMILVGGIAANVAQVGFRPSFQAMAPDLNKLDPIRGAKRLVALRSLVELIKSILKVVVVGMIAYRVIDGSFEKMLGMGLLSIGEMMTMVGGIALQVLWNCCLALCALALLDLLYQRYDHEKQLRMTKKEVKDEHKDMEGSPLVRSRQRSIQREMAMRRMMADVPKADVILTNPTHYAVALKYDPEKGAAPIVTAKGAGFIAFKIREIAEKANVPVLERPPLTRQIFREVDLGKAIPHRLYEAVAEILAYIYNLQGRAAR